MFRLFYYLLCVSYFIYSSLLGRVQQTNLNIFSNNEAYIVSLHVPTTHHYGNMEIVIKQLEVCLENQSVKLYHQTPI